jgi:hypothetical protein
MSKLCINMQSDSTVIHSLIIRNPKLFVPWLFQFYPFEENWIHENERHVDWVALSKNEAMQWSERLILKYVNRWQMEFLSKNEALPWSADLIKAVRRPFDRNALSFNKGIPWNFELINKFRDKWNWYALIQNESIEWTKEMLIAFEQMDKNLSVVNGQNLWTDEFISNHAEKINWAHLTYNHKIYWDKPRLRKFEKYFKKYEARSAPNTVSPWKGISSNSNIPWSINFIETYRERIFFRLQGLNWDYLSSNPFLTWADDDLLERYAKNWNWTNIGLNEGIVWDEKLFETYKYRLPWIASSLSTQSIARNKSLPWSESFIMKYKSEWQWWFLSINGGVPFDENLIKTFETEIVWSQLFLNPNAPWSLDFLMKHEKDITYSWDHASDEFKTFIWEKFFKPIIDEHFMENLFSAFTNPYKTRAHATEKKLNNEQQLILDLGDVIGNMSFDKNTIENPSKRLEDLKDEIQNLLYKMALSPEIALRLCHQSLFDLYAILDVKEKSFCDALLSNVYNHLGHIIEETNDFYEFHREVFLKHDIQNQQFMAGLEKDIHLNQDMEYYQKYIETFGLRTLEIISLMVSLEKFDHIKSNPFIPTHTSPF